MDNNTERNNIESKLSDQMWRLNNLYYIVNKDGDKVLLKLNWCQRELLENLWYRSIVLKGRQFGITTAIQAYILDMCIFNNNLSAGVIADTMPHAEAIFNDKIKFMYDNLPPDIKEAAPAIQTSRRELTFANGSAIRVNTSFVSGTIGLLHVSELAATAADSEQKAQSIMTHTAAAVPMKGTIIVECTSRGPGGMFQKIWGEAVQDMKDIDEGKMSLSPLHYVPRFFPTYSHPEYRVTDPKFQMSDMLHVYFDQLEEKTGADIEQDFKVWYSIVSKQFGDRIRTEYPNTMAEAFDVLIEGAIFDSYVREVETDGRIAELPVKRTLPVNFAFDIGYTDYTAIWGWQQDSGWSNFIWAYSNRFKDATFYCQLLDELRAERGWSIGTVYLPHDSKQKSAAAVAGSVEDIFLDRGFRVETLARPSVKNASIEATRQVFDSCRFDRVACAEGIKALKTYRWKFDAVAGVFTRTIHHDDFSHFADAFQTYALGVGDRRIGYDEKVPTDMRGRSLVRGDDILHRRANPMSRLTNPSLRHVL